LAEVAARDRYRCGFCRKRVAMKQVVPHPRAPTIDHVVPLADGGDDTRANVRLAHFLCNVRAQTGGDKQLALCG
jgi:5-methylcytosine-specific restriction endonuclease McrA